MLILGKYSSSVNDLQTNSSRLSVFVAQFDK